MSSALKAAYDALTAKYETHTGAPLITRQERLGRTISQPTWSWVGSDLSLSMNGEHGGGAVLDPDIGLCAFFLAYTSSQDAMTQISHALRIRSALMPTERTYSTATFDTNGSWRVALHWLMEEHHVSEWLDRISAIRSDTAHFEEVPVDAIVFNGKNWDTTFADYGFPRLLLRTREILDKNNIDLIDTWASADVHVRRIIERFPDHFTSARARSHAAQVRDHLATSPKPPARHKASEASPRTLTKLRIQNFRNVGSLSFDFPELIGASVIHGPNGTGKSSVFEALSFALSGSSFRFNVFSRDSNDSSKDKLQRYLDDYLAPLGRADPSTRVAVDDITWRPSDAFAPLADGVEQDLAGTMLSQDESANLLRLSRAQLGSEVLGDASEHSNMLRSFAESRHDEARARQLRFLDEWGLNKNIRNSDTVVARIAARFVEREFSTPNQLAWLVSDQTLAYPIWRENRDAVRHVWDRHAEATRMLIADLPNLRDSMLTMSRRIGDVIVMRQNAVQQTNSFLSDVRSSLSAWPSSALNDIKRWSTWLQNSGSKTSLPETGRELFRRQIELQRRQTDIAKSGGRLNARAKHLSDTKAFAKEHDWIGHHGETCPTCESALGARNGLLRTIDQIKRVLDDELRALRSEYQNVTAELRAVERQLIEAGLDVAPVDAERQAELVSLLQRFVGGEDDVRHTLGDATRTNALLREIDYVLRAPENIVERWPDGKDQELAKVVGDAFTMSDLASEDENAWREVKTKLVQQLSSVVDEHLPSTLQALWREIALNLTPIRVQLPAPFGLAVDARGNQPVATFVVTPNDGRQRLAHYILNSAEIRILGLSWFFVRYLLKGRFRRAFMALDDPAQEMDQPTYRELCRFWETLLRLHRRRAIPLQLLVFLHQDERALDAARATDATIHFLGWNSGRTSLLRSTRMFGSSIAAPEPASAFASTD